MSKTNKELIARSIVFAALFGLAGVGLQYIVMRPPGL